MQDRLETRMAELREELVTGERLLQQLHSQQRHLERNLLRIGGAVKVLEEMLEEAGEAGAPKAAEQVVA